MKHRENEIYMNFKVRTSRTDGQSPLYVRLTFTGADNAINTGINVNVAKWKRLGSVGYFESVEGVRAKALALKVQVTLRSLKAKGVQDIEFVKEQVAAIAQNEDSEEIENIKKPEFGISDCRFSCYARFPIGAYYICPPNNMDGKMQEL